MKKIAVILTITGLCMALGACSTFMDKDNTPDPAKLTHFIPETSLTKQWYVNTGPGAGNEYLKLSPAIQDNVIFTASKNGTVTATDATTGHITWQTHLRTEISSGVSAYKNLLFLGTPDARVIALNTANGSIYWEKSVPSEVLALITAKQNIALIKTIDGRITAVSTQSGHTLWHYQQSPPELILRGGSAPKISHDNAIVGFSTGKLAKLSLEDGSLAWLQTVAYPEGTFAIQRMVDIDADPIIINDRVYVATYQGNIAALDLASGKAIWTHKISSYAGITADNHRVYISDANSHVWAFDAETGMVLWTQKDLYARNITGPAILGNYVLVADGSGYIHLMNQQDGHFVARTYVSTPAILATPVIKNNTVYIYNRAGDLAAYTLT